MSTPKKHVLKAVIFQDGKVKSKDASGKEIVLIHTAEIAAKDVKKDINTFLGGLLKTFFTPITLVINAGKPNSYTMPGESKVGQLKDIKISFQLDGKQVLLTSKVRLNSCIGKGLASLNFGKLAYQTLGLIAESTEDNELLTAIAVVFKAAGKTDSDIAKLKDEAKVEIAKTGLKIANVAIRGVRREVKENSQYGVYLTELTASKKLLIEAAKKAAIVEPAK